MPLKWLYLFFNHNDNAKYAIINPTEIILNYVELHETALFPSDGYPSGH